MDNQFERQDSIPEKEFRDTFEIAEKSEDLKNKVMKLLHQYPNHFVPGLFEKMAEQDFDNSDIMVAVRDDRIIGCLMFNREANEFNWLAVSKEIEDSKAKIAKQLFGKFYSTIAPGTTVHFFVNTEDAYIPGNKLFSGKNFERARNLYRTMGLELKEDNIVKDCYGEGADAYRVEWKIGKQN